MIWGTPCLGNLHTDILCTITLTRSRFQVTMPTMLRDMGGQKKIDLINHQNHIIMHPNLILRFQIHGVHKTTHH